MAVKVIKKGKELDVILEDAKKPFLLETGRQIRVQAKLLVRVDTGDLRSSIKRRIKGTVENGFIEVVANKEYAAAQEFGLRLYRKTRYGFTPFMRPAVKRVMKNTQGILGRSIKRASKGIGLK